MLGNRLARHFGAVRECGRRKRFAGPELSHDSQPGFVAEGEEHIDIVPDVLRLSCPASLVHAKRALAAVRRNAIEPRLADREQRSPAGTLEAKLDQGGWLDVRIGLGIESVRNPPKAEVKLRLEPLVESSHDRSTNDEFSFEFQAEPLREVPNIADRPPNS